MKDTRWERWLGAQQFERLLEVAEQYKNEFEQLYKDRLKSNGYVASGKLLDVHAKVKVGYDVITISFSAENYWKWVEHGRNNGKRPPIDAILKWVKDKHLPIESRLDKNGKSYLPTEQQLAFLISRSIGEKGTIKRENYKGSDIVARTVEELNDKYEPLFIQAIQDDVNDGINSAIDVILEPFKN